MLLVKFCLIRPIFNLFAKADFPDVHELAREGHIHQDLVDMVHNGDDICKAGSGPGKEESGVLENLRESCHFTVTMKRGRGVA